MVILTKLIISNIKNIKSNYIFFDLDFDFIFEDEDIHNTDFDNDFIQKIIKVYEERKTDERLDDSLADEIFGKFLKKIKDYLDYLIKIENNIIDLNKFSKKNIFALVAPICSINLTKTINYKVIYSNQLGAKFYYYLK